MSEPPIRPGKIVLRDERHGADSRYLEAYLDDEGNLHFEGQDLGPGTEPVGVDGEYEWFETIAARHVPRVVEVLGGTSGEEVLVVLRRYAGRGAYEVGKRISDSGIPITREVW